MAARYRFVSCHPVQGYLIDSNLGLIDPKWNWTIGGNGQLTAKIAVPEDLSPRELLRVATKPWQSAIYVKKTSDNSYPWGGPVIKRTWNRRSGQITITCVEWRAWPYMLILEPHDPDRWFTFINDDQLEIARALLKAVTGAFSGSPQNIVYNDAQTSGKLRDLNFYGSQMKRCGATIDEMANRDGGFEWTLAPQPDSITGLPRLHFINYYPERGSLISSLHFRSTPSGTNCDPGDIEQDASQQYNRVWTTGAGQPPDMMFGYDIDPMQPFDNTLRLDYSTAFSSVVQRDTLMSHARRIRKFYSEGTQILPLQHNFQQIDPDSYNIGDRGRAQIRDRWTDLDVTAARVLSKEINMAGAGSVSTVLDLTDYTMPETDTGGAI